MCEILVPEGGTLGARAVLSSNSWRSCLTVVCRSIGCGAGSYEGFIGEAAQGGPGFVKRLRITSKDLKKVEVRGVTRL